jgi:hypothetical protein
MKKKYLKLVFSFFIIVHFACAQSHIQAYQLQSLNASDDFEKIIIRESKSLDSLIFATPVWTSTEVDTQYDEIFGVIINKTSISQLLNDKSAEDKAFLLRLIIAHEKMHARQISMLRNIGKSYDLLSVQEKQWLESQADICAGYAAFFPRIKELSALLFQDNIAFIRSQATTGHQETIPGIDQPDQERVTKLIAQNEEGIRLFFKLGDNEGQFGLHPDSYSRQMAFQLGVSAFFINVIQLYLYKEMSNVTPLEWQLLNKQLLAIFQTLGVVSEDYIGSVFFDRWSERTAAKIVHFIQNTAKNVIFKVIKQQWDTTAENPFLYFEIEVTNKNTESVYVDMSVLTKLAPRLANKNPLLTKLGFSWQRYFLLSSNETKIYRDSVMWGGVSDRMMPKVFYPGEQGSLYSVVLANPAGLPNHVNTGDIEKFTVESSDLKSFIGSLPAIYRQFNLGQTDSQKSGSGLKFLDRSEIEYSAYFFNTHFKLIVPDNIIDKPFLLGSIAEYETAEASRIELKRCIAIFSDTFPEYTIIDNGNDFYELKNAAGTVNFAFYIEKNYYTHELLVEINKI